MPTYAYKCSDCGHEEDQVRAIADRDSPAPCSIRGAHGLACEGTFQRDVIGSMKAHTDTGYHTPVLSQALGVSPDQIAEAKKRFPSHNFHPDGRMILESHTERKRVMKDLGYHDKDGYT